MTGVKNKIIYNKNNNNLLSVLDILLYHYRRWFSAVATYMSEKATSHHGRLPLTCLKLWQEVVTVEVIKFLQVTEDDPSLAPEVLGNVWSVQQGEVVGQDVAQWADILSLCEDQLLQDTLQPPDETGQVKSSHWPEFNLNKTRKAFWFINKSKVGSAGLEQIIEVYLGAVNLIGREWQESWGEGEDDTQQRARTQTHSCEDWA